MLHRKDREAQNRQDKVGCGLVLKSDNMKDRTCGWGRGFNPGIEHTIL